MLQSVKLRLCHYGQWQASNKITNNTASTGPIRSESCRFPPEISHTKFQLSSFIKGKKGLTFAFTHWGFETDTVYD